MGVEGASDYGGEVDWGVEGVGDAEGSDFASRGEVDGSGEQLFRFTHAYESGEIADNQVREEPAGSSNTSDQAWPRNHVQVSLRSPTWAQKSVRPHRPSLTPTICVRTFMPRDEDRSLKLRTMLLGPVSSKRMRVQSMMR